jgi:hypothetical protein
MFQSNCRIHVAPEAPIDLKRIPRSNLAANLEKGVAFTISPGLLLHHDSVATKATVKRTTGGDFFVLPGALGPLTSSTIAW